VSGGAFDYSQYKIEEIRDQIKEVVRNNDSTEKDEWGYDKGHHYSKDTIEQFNIAIGCLGRAAVFAQRIDWLLSGDDGEESFHRRLHEDLSLQ